MRTKARFIADAFCFCGMGAVLSMCGIHYTDWRYWAIFLATFVIAMIQWVCGRIEGG